MADFREEAYILEKMEITEDDDDNFDYEEIKDSDQELQDLDNSDDEDLNNFEALKAKTNFKLQTKAGGIGADGAASMKTFKPDPKPKRDVVIDDFIRNFLSRFSMSKTQNIFMQEWHDLQKKGTFHDNSIGFITDIENKNLRLKDKVEKMRGELAEAKIAAEQAKSTWEKLRKERDFHKTHQNRVNTEKVTINSNIKKIKDLHEQYEERIEEIKKKLQTTVKEKALLKLEKEKLLYDGCYKDHFNKNIFKKIQCKNLPYNNFIKQCRKLPYPQRVNEIQKHIKDDEDRVSKEIEDSHKRQQMGMKGDYKPQPAKGKNTPYPEDARPNPFLARTYEDINPKLIFQKKVDAHSKGIGGFSLHLRKQIVATASDDCTWKIWNLENGENIMTGEGHKDWICGIDFHPQGSHLVTSGSDKCVKIWDFINSTIAHTFTDVHTGPVWKTKFRIYSLYLLFHDTGDFVLSAGGDGAIKLYDLNALKVRQQYRSHTDSVNGLNFQPFTNFFVSGSADKTLSIWDMRTGLTVQTFYGHLNTINDTIFSIGGQFIASCDSDGIVKVWDIRMVREMCQVDTGDAIALSVSFDKNSKFVAVGCSDAEIKMINIDKAEIVSVLKAHEDAVNGVVFNHDNNSLYSIGSDGTIRIWK